MTADAKRRSTLNALVLACEVACALVSLFLIAGGVYGHFANFQPSIAHVTSMIGTVVLTWLPIGAFILADVMLFRRDKAKMFVTGAVLIISTLYVITFVGALLFWNVGMPAWRSVGQEGESYSYSYTVTDKAAIYDSWLCPGRITINSHIWFKRRVCGAPEETWRDAKVGAGLTLIGFWTPEGLRYTDMALKP